MTSRSRALPCGSALFSSQRCCKLLQRCLRCFSGQSHAPSSPQLRTRPQSTSLQLRTHSLPGVGKPLDSVVLIFIPDTSYWLRADQVSAEGHRLMMPSGPHHLLKAVMRSSGHQTATPPYHDYADILSMIITNRIGDKCSPGGSLHPSGTKLTCCKERRHSSRFGRTEIGSPSDDLDHGSTSGAEPSFQVPWSRLHQAHCN